MSDDRPEPGPAPLEHPSDDREEPEAAEDPEAGQATGGRDPEERRIDHELIRRAQGGDPDAFGELVHRHQGRAYRVARNLVPNREDALDQAQEAFLRVYKNLHRFDFKHDFTTWLYRITTNLCIDHLRRRRPAMSTSSREESEPDFDLEDEGVEMPDRGLEREETKTRVREVIDSLAPHFQAVLTLRELEGLPCTEIAEIVGATHVTVRWRLHRGRKLFQEEWERRERMAEASGDSTLGDRPRPPADEEADEERGSGRESSGSPTGE